MQRRKGWVGSNSPRRQPRSRPRRCSGWCRSGRWLRSEGSSTSVWRERLVRTILWSLLCYKRFWRNTMCFSSQREGFISSSSLNRSLNNNYCSLMASTTKNGQNLNSKFTGATLHGHVVQQNFIYWQCLTDFAWFCQIHSSPVGLLFTFRLLI